MSETAKTLEQQALEAVEKYADNRHSHMRRADLLGFNPEELDRLKTSDVGDLIFTIEDVHVDETEVEDSETIWYVSATAVFQVDDGGEPFVMDPDIYQCYLLDDGKWEVSWHAS